MWLFNMRGPFISNRGGKRCGAGGGGEGGGEGGREGGGMSCVPWPKWKKETALTQLLVDGDVDGANLGPVPHMHTVDCLFWSTLFNHTNHTNHTNGTMMRGKYV